MHYYQFNIGDYRAATAHLSNDEDLAYRRLLDMYYDTEQKIPLDIQWVARRLRVGTQVVEAVLADMFEKQDDGWFHARCDEIINQYKEFAEAGKRGAAKRWANKGVTPPNGEANSPPTPPPIATNNDKLKTNNHLTVSKDTVRPPAGEPAEKPDPKIPPCDYRSVLALYHQTLPTLPTVEVWNKTRSGYLKQRWREVAIDLSDKGPVTHAEILDWWKTFFEHVKGSAFLMGKKPAAKDKPPFLADLEWIIRPTNFAKIIEGKYHRD